MKIELSHDLLAKKIYDKASTEDKMRMKISNFIRGRFVYFKENKVLLSKENLDYIAPYLEKLTLEPAELIFIERSKRALWLKFAVAGGIIVAIILLMVYSMNKREQRKIESQAFMTRQLLEYQRVETEAEQLSNALFTTREGLNATKKELRLALLQLQQKNDTLLHDYAVYKVSQSHDNEQLIKELHVAQSARMSELAAPIVYTNRKYAFQLATQAWYLNPENQQAMKIIYQTVNATLEKPFSKEKTRNFIKRKEKKWGKLSAKKMEAILNPENTVVVSDEKRKTAEEIKKVTKVDEFPIRGSVPDEQEKKVKAEMSKLQETLQNKIQQKQKNRPTNLPK
ncbi:MAG: hypothetical protein ACI976_000135 [Aureispira sp.]|jgi:hypothetical protein